MTPAELVGSGRVTFTRAETARILGIDARTVSAAIGRGEIAAVQYGQRVLVLADPLRAQLAVVAGPRLEDHHPPDLCVPSPASPPTTGVPHAAAHPAPPTSCRCCGHP